MNSQLTEPSVTALPSSARRSTQDGVKPNSSETAGSSNDSVPGNRRFPAMPCAAAVGQLITVAAAISQLASQARLPSRQSACSRRRSCAEAGED